MNKVVLHGKKAILSLDQPIQLPYQPHDYNVEVSADGKQLWICQDGQSIIRIRVLGEKE